jgi:hypothetical protein
MITRKSLHTSVWAIGAKAEAEATIRAETTAVYFIFLEDGWRIKIDLTMRPAR